MMSQLHRSFFISCAPSENCNGFSSTKYKVIHLGTKSINHNNERKDELENSDSDEDSGIIKDKPLNKLQMQKE